ncbi:MAG: hypothetical protein Kow0059_11640 [Candidatus Sumerlaeia bacterium]
MGFEQFSTGATLYSHERYSMIEGRQNAPDRPVLVHKLSLYYSDNKQCMEQCTARVREWAQWRHPFVLEIFDAWKTATDLVFVTRRPAGRSIAEAIRNMQEFAPDMSFNLVVQAASALRFLHEQNEPHGRLDLECFTFEVDQWIVLSQPGWGVKLNTIVEEQNMGIISGGEEERALARLQDIVDWAVLAGALFTADLEFGYKSLGGQRTREVSVDASRSLMNTHGVPEAMQQVILAALQARSPGAGAGRLTSFEQVLSALRDVRVQ